LDSDAGDVVVVGGGRVMPGWRVTVPLRRIVSVALGVVVVVSMVAACALVGVWRSARDSMGSEVIVWWRKFRRVGGIDIDSHS